MKKIYKMVSKGILLFVTGMMMVSCSQDLSYQEAMNKNERKIEDPGKREDAVFLVEAKSNSLLEKKLTEYASVNGYASAIVNLAKKNLNEVKSLAEGVDGLARKEKIAVPEMMDEHDQAKYYEVSRAEREDFDKQFIMTMKHVNDDNIQRFVQMATDAKDDDVRAFAARHLDTFKNRALRLDEVEKELLNTY